MGTDTDTDTTTTSCAPTPSTSSSGSWPATTSWPQTTGAGSPTADVVAVNLMSSPGSGKTTLLERTIRELGRPVTRGRGRPGDGATTPTGSAPPGARAVQVNTGSGCHLDATMVHQALVALDPEPGSLVVVENVGNLVCPALFDVGEAAKVVVISVTEGDDKPLKYPHMFAVADLVLVNKTDLLPYVDFDVDRLTADARKLEPGSRGPAALGEDRRGAGRLVRAGSTGSRRADAAGGGN